MPTAYSEKFTTQQDVVDCLKELKTKFNGDNPLLVSDVIDTEGYQYVHLVQKGGGVLGVALLGYTFVLEEMGIRFIRLAGTSAGAINTALMAVTGSHYENGKLVGDKTIAKSEKILETLGELNFFNLVDGHAAARRIIKFFVTVKGLQSKLTTAGKAAAAIIGLLFLVSFVAFGFQTKIAVAANIAKVSFVLSGLIIAFIAMIVSYAVYLYNRLKVSGYGINPGDFFLEWVDQRFKENHVNTVTDLRQVASTPVNGLRMRQDAVSNLDDLKGDVTFITSELVTENKIEFPLMAEYFAVNVDDLEPARFVRASMAIPVFFESVFVENIPCTVPAVVKLWKENLGEDDPPTTARFVDGGILSNFPINIFYNAKITGKPRLPSFGIDLDDELEPDKFFVSPAIRAAQKPEGDESKNPGKWTLGGYFGRLFNTTRFYYDKDFLIKNAFFKKGIGKIPLKKYNWLNFFLTEDEKIAMFILGARAASQFLQEFDWESYKGEREIMNKTIMK